MNGPIPRDSFDDLLERLCLDELSATEWQELAERIADDKQGLQSYIEAVRWRQSLGYLVGDDTRPHSPAVHLFDDRAAGQPFRGAVAESVPPAGSSSGLDIVKQFDRRSGQRWRGLFGSWALAVSVAFVAGAGITGIILGRAPEPSRQELALTPKELPPLPIQPAPFVQESQLGKVSGLSLEASADGLLRTLQVGQELRCGEVIQLTSGFMRVTLHSGPELIIEAPAEFSIIGKDSVFIRVGRVAASRADNLLLQSPKLTADCNDADVLFIADEDTSTSVYAYKGVVTMRSMTRRQAGNGKLAVLHEGQGLLVRPETTTEHPSQIATDPPQGAVRSWAEVEARLTDSQRLVLSDRPVAYWPLYRVRRNRRVLDLTQHGFDGQAIGNWPLESVAETKVEPGALFNGESYIEPDRKPPLNLRTGFTVEGWAKVSGGPEFQSIFTCRWVLDAHTPHLQCLGFTLYAGKNDRWQVWTGTGRYGELWRELHSDVELVRHRWTHVVASFEPGDSADVMPVESVTGTVYIYVDGKLAAQDIREMSLMDFDWPARIGAAEFVPNSLTAWLFRGHLRDIAVYDYPLEPARIRAHYEAGKKAG